MSKIVPACYGHLRELLTSAKRQHPEKVADLCGLILKDPKFFYKIRDAERYGCSAYTHLLLGDAICTWIAQVLSQETLAARRMLSPEELEQLLDTVRDSVEAHQFQREQARLEKLAELERDRVIEEQRLAQKRERLAPGRAERREKSRLRKAAAKERAEERAEALGWK